MAVLYCHFDGARREENAAVFTILSPEMKIKTPSFSSSYRERYRNREYIDTSPNGEEGVWDVPGMLMTPNIGTLFAT